MGLLRAGWVAAILPILIASLPFSWMTSFHGLVLGFAKRGKIMQASSKVTIQLVFGFDFVGLCCG